MAYTRSIYKKAVEATGVDSENLIEVYAASGATVLCEVPRDTDFGKNNNDRMIPNGTVLEISRETLTGWGLATISGEYAWINLKETKTHKNDIDVKQYEIDYVYALSPDGKGVTMWTTADADSVCAVIPDCTRLIKREKSGDYIYVSYAGMSGWIDRRCTEISLFNAQVKSGQRVEESYIIDCGKPENEVELLSVPSYKDKDGADILDTIKDGTEVFVLRRVRGDWNLIAYDGQLGWIPPGSIKKTADDKDGKIEVYTAPEEGYIATSKGKGLTLFADASKYKKTAILPETLKIKIIAKSNV